MIRTRFTELAGVDHPIVLGGMGGTSPELVAADTIATEIPDVGQGWVWPGACARVKRNRLVEEWIGREGELRRRRVEVAARMAAAREVGDTDYAILHTGQTAGLIDGLMPAAEVVASIAADAEAVVRDRLSSLLQS